MEPMTLILDAIVLGLKKGLEKAAGDTMAESFQTMLAKIKERLSSNFKEQKVAEAEQTLMRSGDDKEREKLKKILAAAEVDEDKEIIEAARLILSALKNTRGEGDTVSIGRDINVTVNGGTVEGDVSGVKIVH